MDPSDGKYDSLWQSLSGVVLSSSLLSWDKSQSSVVDEIPKKGTGLMTIEFLLEDMTLGR